MSEELSEMPTFSDLALAEPITKALKDVGYEVPTPIQAATIPHLLEGRDVIGQAQTGTGKTAAFALPLLSHIDLKRREPQVLVLTPTRELGIQVAEAFQRYAAHLRGFQVLPIYGGQSYEVQLRQLKRGVHVVVGTPGRVMDHMRRGTLRLEGLTCLILDEADEMLRMGFIDDVEWILEQTPPERQTALFSATMPKEIRRIAQKYLRNPQEVTMKTQRRTADTINQRYWIVSGFHKLDALTRILESETFDGMIVFVRTRNATIELAEKLQARGYDSTALNGDIPQKQREQTVEKLRKGKLDILVATDVAARGLDVERVSHVINYDMPSDVESYIHRVGRTGRAGRSGEAILFVAPREKHLLFSIEKSTAQKIERMDMPSADAINLQRITRFKERITNALSTEDLGFYYNLVEQYEQEYDVPGLVIASALAKLVQGDEPLLLKAEERRVRTHFREDADNDRRPGKSKAFGGGKFARSSKPMSDSKGPSSGGKKKLGEPDAGMDRFRLEVGHQNGVKPGNIVGAIANEIGLESRYIGRINIFDDYSTVDLPGDMPREVLDTLRQVRVGGQPLRISRMEKARDEADAADKKKKKKKKAK